MDTPAGPSQDDLPANHLALAVAPKYANVCCPPIRGLLLNPPNRPPGWNEWPTASFQTHPPLYAYPKSLDAQQLIDVAPAFTGVPTFAHENIIHFRHIRLSRLWPDPESLPSKMDILFSKERMRIHWGIVGATRGDDADLPDFFSTMPPYLAQIDHPCTRCVGSKRKKSDPTVGKRPCLLSTTFRPDKDGWVTVHRCIGCEMAKQSCVFFAPANAKFDLLTDKGITTATAGKPYRLEMRFEPDFQATYNPYDPEGTPWDRTWEPGSIRFISLDIKRYYPDPEYTECGEELGAKKAPAGNGKGGKQAAGGPKPRGEQTAKAARKKRMPTADDELEDDSSATDANSHARPDDTGDNGTEAGSHAKAVDIEDTLESISPVAKPASPAATSRSNDTGVFVDPLAFLDEVPPPPRTPKWNTGPSAKRSLEAVETPSKRHKTLHGAASSGHVQGSSGPSKRLEPSTPRPHVGWGILATNAPNSSARSGTDGRPRGYSESTARPSMGPSTPAAGKSGHLRGNSESTIRASEPAAGGSGNSDHSRHALSESARDRIAAFSPTRRELSMIAARAKFEEMFLGPMTRERDEQKRRAEKAEEQRDELQRLLDQVDQRNAESSRHASPETETRQGSLADETAGIDICMTIRPDLGSLIDLPGADEALFLHRAAVVTHRDGDSLVVRLVGNALTMDRTVLGQVMPRPAFLAQSSLVFDPASGTRVPVDNDAPLRDHAPTFDWISGEVAKAKRSEFHNVGFDDRLTPDLAYERFRLSAGSPHLMYTFDYFSRYAVKMLRGHVPLDLDGDVPDSPEYAQNVHWPPDTAIRPALLAATPHDQPLSHDAVVDRDPGFVWRGSIKA